MERDERHGRRSICLKGYDYTRDGAYFVTICTQERLRIFGTIVVGDMQLNECGQEVAHCWAWLAEQYPYVCLDEWIVMPDHTHIVTIPHKLSVEDVVGYLKRAGTRKLNALDLHPLKDFRKRDGSIPTPWVENGWNRFLNDWHAVKDAIDYVGRNPLKIGLPRQTWSFVEPLDKYLPRPQ